MSETRRSLKITYHRRSTDSFLGRFGGGWNWKLGIQIGGRTAIVSLLVFDLRFDIE